MHCCMLILATKRSLHMCFDILIMSVICYYAYVVYKAAVPDVMLWIGVDRQIDYVSRV